MHTRHGSCLYSPKAGSRKPCPKGTIWARGQVNEPPNRLRPRDSADRTAERSAGAPAQVVVYEREQLERHGFAAAVGKGSGRPPVYIEVRYCTDRTKPLIALIGSLRLLTIMKHF